MKGKIFKIKNTMMTFISIEYSEPQILTWNLHHHSPSHLAVLFCLLEKLGRHVPLTMAQEGHSPVLVFDSPVMVYTVQLWFYTV